MMDVFCASGSKTCRYWALGAVVAVACAGVLAEGNPIDP